MNVVSFYRDRQSGRDTRTFLGPSKTGEETFQSASECPMLSCRDKGKFSHMSDGSIAFIIVGA